MSKTRLASVLSVMALVCAIAAAALNYINNGRITWKAVVGLLTFVGIALVVRTLGASTARSSAETNERARK